MQLVEQLLHFPAKANVLYVQPSRRDPMIVGSNEANMSGVDGQALLALEEKCRKTAYAQTSLNASCDLFDDADMLSPYHLIVIHDPRSLEPLLTARLYENRVCIEQSIGRSLDQLNAQRFSTGKVQSPLEHIVLIDRLSGNVHNAVYKRFRALIHLQLYCEIFRLRKNAHFILMARHQPGMTLINRYVELGLKPQWDALHHGKQHTVLLGKLNRFSSPLELSLSVSAFEVFLWARKLYLRLFAVIFTHLNTSTNAA
ncbi:MAG: hypothetical protein RLP15_00455 [Cryomorphaceae bacterium]